MESHTDIIDALGGYAKVAEALGLPKGTVSAFKSRGSIPSEHWLDIANFAKAEGKPEITVELLAKLQAPRQRRASAATDDASATPQPEPAS